MPGAAPFSPEPGERRGAAQDAVAARPDAVRAHAPPAKSAESRAEDSGPAQVTFEREPDGILLVRLSGRWRLGEPRPDVQGLTSELRREPARRVIFELQGVESWDTGLLSWLRAAGRIGTELEVEVERSRLPAGIAELLRLSELVLEPPRDEPQARLSLLGRVGARAASLGSGALETLGFIGSVALAGARLVTLRAQFRPSDLQRMLQAAGADAVPITTLVSVIVGLILAFVGAVQLRLFGADLYVADLVGVAMVREMGAMVVGIIMAGRTGAAYAAQLATMKVTEEVDALKTFGISTVDFLVLPRVLALFVMMPFLCLYSMVLGILGGAIVGVGMLGLSRQLYLDQTLQAVTLSDLYGGLFHGAVYGLLIGIIGCRRGLNCGNDAGAVGEATTSAVVTALVAIVVADGLMAVIFDALGV